jgi:hypothetical protein
MSTTKKVLGDYYIKSAYHHTDESVHRSIDAVRVQYVPDIPTAGHPDDKVVVTIDGDLVVLGASTTVESETLTVADNEIVLNAGETGNGITVPGNTAGIAIDRGLAPTVRLRYNDNLDYWEATDDGVAWYPLNPMLGSAFELINDLTPQLGGDLDVNGFTITSASNGNVIIDANGTGEVRLNHELSLEEQASDPSVTANYNKLYAKTAGSGGSGLYTVNSQTSDELVTNTQAMIYALIF